MSVQFRCRSCGRRLSADSRLAGAKLKCPACGQVVEVPSVPEGTASVREAKPSEPSPPVTVQFPKAPLADDQIDMTPMIDCVFLLLIFYVVTATFAYQKSLELPTPERESAAPAKNLEDILESDEYIIIRVDKESTIWVNESETRSRQDLLAKLRSALQASDSATERRASELLVLADPDARHEAVVMALDAGNAIGMENIRLATVADEEF